MKPSSSLAWTKKQRAALSGIRAPNRSDLPARDEPAEAWAAVRRWIAAAADMPDRTRDRALAAELASLRAETSPPDRLEPRREALRRYLVEASIEHLGTHFWNEPFGPSLAWLWASIDPLASLSLPGEVPRPEGVAPGLELLSLHPPSPDEWLSYPFGLGRYDMGVGYGYWSALRRRLFSLSAEQFAVELDAASSLRERVLASDRRDRMTMLYVLAFVFARDGRWAEEHAAEAIETPQYGQFAGLCLIAPSLTDPALALDLMRAHPVWVDLYTWNLSHLYDIVESLGSEAAPVLRAISTLALKDRVTRQIADAIALAGS